MSPHIVVPVKKLHPDAVLPSYQSDGAAGMDLCADGKEANSPEWKHTDWQSMCMMPRETWLLGTGIAFAIPPGFEGQIRPRSGLAAKHGITVLNSPGTIDSDYRGEIKVLLINLGSKPVVIKRGDRIAQLVIAPVARAALVDVGDRELSDTVRGVGGFGSTGVGVGALTISMPTIDPSTPSRDVGPVSTTPFYTGTLVGK
ncbi:MAG: dUTP diphosphatase [Desulfurellales bacterium]|nr:MAG: dUTP diphosphatase [Desulfurellales bacterium]